MNYTVHSISQNTKTKTKNVTLSAVWPFSSVYIHLAWFILCKYRQTGAPVIMLTLDNMLKMNISLFWCATNTVAALAPFYHTALLYLCTEIKPRFTLARKLIHTLWNVHVVLTHEIYNRLFFKQKYCLKSIAKKYSKKISKNIAYCLLDLGLKGCKKFSSMYHIQPLTEKRQHEKHSNS